MKFSLTRVTLALAHEEEESEAQFDEYLYRAAQCYNEALYFLDK